MTTKPWRAVDVKDVPAFLARRRRTERRLAAERAGVSARRAISDGRVAAAIFVLALIVIALSVSFPW